MTTAPVLVSSQQVQQCLHELQRAAATDSDATRRQFLEAACLRDTFSVPQLREAAGLPREADWVQLAVDAELVTPGRRSGGAAQAARWRLRPVARVAALRALQQQGRLSSILLQPPEPESGRERLLRCVLRNGVEVQHMDFNETAQLREVLQWLEGSEFAGAALQQAAAQRMDRLQLFKPFQRLLAEGFVGRERELEYLRAFVMDEGASDLLPSRRFTSGKRDTRRLPLALFGPGGIGKSTLLAHLLVDLCGPEARDPLPFIYIDIDRLGFRAADLGRFIVEAIRQLNRQTVQSAAEMERELVRLQSWSKDSSSSDSGAINIAWSDWASRFAELVARLPEFNQKPLLFVVDTFEEVQRHGASDEQIALSLFGELQRRVKGLRIIVSGRALPRGSQDFPLQIAGLERPASEALIDAYLKQHGIPTLGSADRTRILDIANDNPLSLRLALRLLRQHGAKALAGIGTRQWLLFRMSDERVQAQLHARVLSHIDDKEIRALAYPGLAVRRITPEVITEVLAAPCGLNVRDAAHAQQLFDKLALEVGLVEPAPDGSLLHRSDVRSVMLESLIEEAGEATIRKIDTAAVAYYETQASAEARAEEIYHRLRLGQSAAQLDARWRDDAAALLANAIDELPASGRLYLASRLNLSVSDELRRSADQATWERLTARTARNALNRGDIASAKASLGERREFLPGSALWEIQAEVLRAGGEFEAAVALVEQATALGGFTAQQAAMLQLVALFASERLPRYEAAVDWHAALQSLDEFHDDELLKLRIDTAGDRLRRKLCASVVEPLSAEALAVLRGRLGLPEKLDRPFAPQQLPSALRRRNSQINLNVLRQLKSRPSLLRELVAEYGLLQPEILYFGLEQLGLPGLGKTDWPRLIARELDDANAWGSDQELRVDLATKLRGQSAINTVVSQTTGEASSAVSAELLASLINWLRHDADARELRELIVRGFRDDVELALGNATLFRNVHITSVAMR